MREIKIKSLSLVNFKGVRNLTIGFNDAETLVMGGNGVGKTTIFDAFLWLLFGKDSAGRSDSNFNIKTLDEFGNPILRLEHSVTGVLSVDGREVKLQRSYVENWSKPRGTTEETLKNHATMFFLNDVKLGTKKEYDTEVSDIVSEDVFKLITNPFFFISLKPEAQKEILFDMAGDVTDDEVANGNQEYIELLAQLNGRSLAQYAKEVASKKRACKDELAVIPSQIETAKNLMPEEEDWSALESSLQDLKDRLKKIDEAIADKYKLNEQEAERKQQIQDEISKKRIAISCLEGEIREKANESRNKAMLELNDTEYQLKLQKSELANLNNKLEALKSDADRKNEVLNALRKEFYEINKMELVYPEGAFVCPTCKRQLEVDDIEAKQREMLENFNANKASRLKDNNARGRAKKAELDAIIQEQGNTVCLAATVKNNIEMLEKSIAEKRASIPEAVNVEALISSEQSIIDLKNEITELTNQMSVDVKPVDVSELQANKNAINEEIQCIVKRSAKREQIERAETEINKLEEKRVANNQKLADLERWEFAALSFQKDKDAELLKRINGMFKFVSFSFVDTQLNGGEKLTCVCTVNGVPYPDVNNAGKVNAGLDIINAICRAKGVYAPVWVDNAEGVNDLLPTTSQIIKLVVTKDESLVIK